MFNSQTQQTKMVLLEPTSVQENQNQILPNMNLKDGQSLSLIGAIQQNNQQAFRSFLNKKVSLFDLGKKATDEVDKTWKGSPVYWAAYYGYKHFIDLLIQAGADVNKPNVNGETPVYVAAQRGHGEIITALHAAGANVDTPSAEISTAGKITVGLAMVTMSSYGARADTMTGGVIRSITNRRRTPVYVAAENGHVAAIAALRAAGANVDTPNANGVTPAYIAAQNGHAAVIAVLHAVGANVNAKIKVLMGSRDVAPILIAAQEGHAQVIIALHAAGADVNQPDKDEVTPLYVAAKYGHVAAVTALLEIGANATFGTRWGTALEAARQGKETGHKAVVNILETHLKQYPNGIKPVKDAAKELKVINELPPEPQEFVSANPLLQVLKEIQFAQGFTDPGSQQTDSEIAEILVQNLEEIAQEKQELEQDYQKPEVESKHLQETLQKEIEIQTSEYAFLEEQQAVFQKQISDLKKSFIQKSITAQQEAPNQLKALQEQLLVIKLQQDILSDKYEAKAQKQAALKRFQSHPNLVLFYRTVHIKLEEIFISFKAVAGGFVNPVDGNFAIAKSVFDSIGDAVSIAPVIGTAIEKILKATVSKGLEKLDSTRQKNTAINASGLVTLSEVKKYAESVARRLTERYADQLVRLATFQEATAAIHQLGKTTNTIKEKALKEQYVPPAKQLAAFGVLWIIDRLYNIKNIDESKELDEVLFSIISKKTPANKFKGFWQEITMTLGIQGIFSKSGEIWHPEAVYTLPGIRVGNQYYSGGVLEPQKYGWRVGTVEEVNALGLKLVTPSSPLTQVFILENQAIIQPILVASKAVQAMQQGAIGEVLAGMQTALAKEKKDKEELTQRVEKLENALSALIKILENLPKTVSPTQISPPAILTQFPSYVQFAQNASSNQPHLQSQGIQNTASQSSSTFANGPS